MSTNAIRVIKDEEQKLIRVVEEMPDGMLKTIEKFAYDDGESSSIDINRARMNAEYYVLGYRQALENTLAKSPKRTTLEDTVDNFPDDHRTHTLEDRNVERPR